MSGFCVAGCNLWEEHDVKPGAGCWQGYRLDSGSRSTIGKALKESQEGHHINEGTEPLMACSSTGISAMLGVINNQANSPLDNKT
jgi:hypothetical protein